jgi:pyruvate kinase
VYAVAAGTAVAVAAAAVAGQVDEDPPAVRGLADLQPVQLGGGDDVGERDAALEQAESYLKSQAVVSSGDVYAITCGEPMGAPGGTNMLKICTVG